MAKLTMAQIAGVAVDAGFPDGAATVPVMVAIAMAESGGVTTAKNPTSSATGLWQEVKGNWMGLDPTDPLSNGKMAHDTYRRQGLRAWAVYTSGAYLAFLPAATAAAKSPDHSYPGGSGGTSGDASAGGSTPTNSDSTGISANLAKITMGSMWVRVGAFLLGTALLIFGLLRLTGADKTIVKFAKTAAEVAVLK
jgi:hypothetical protein